MLVELKGIQKKYGKSLILDNIDLSIPEGEALAIIGGNGTGKSTLLKIIAGFISHTAGTIQRKEHIQIGYVPEHFPEGIRFTLEDYLFHLGRIHGLSTKYVKDKIPLLLERFHLLHARHSVIRNFSKGMKQNRYYASITYGRPFINFRRTAFWTRSELSARIRTYFTLIKTTRYIYTLHMSRKTATRKLRR